MIGIEAKRYEPFRDLRKAVDLSDAYDRKVWGDKMGPFETMRDGLRGGRLRFRHLDASQLVKHAFGLRTQAARAGLAPVLVYLYAEPKSAEDIAVTAEAKASHRAEIREFAAAIAGAEVRFESLSYQDWLVTWPGEAKAHAAAVRGRFAP